MGDLYYELAVQIIENCIRTRATNGGMMALDEILSRVCEARKKRKLPEVTRDDLLFAMRKVEVLGSGFKLIRVRNQELVLSVPLELSKDHQAVLEIAQEKGGCCLPSELAARLGWDALRIETALQTMMRQGLVWVDNQGRERSYWVVSLFVPPKDAASSGALQ